MKYNVNYWLSIVIIFIVYAMIIQFSVNEWADYFKFDPISFPQAVTILLVPTIFIPYLKNLFKNFEDR